MADLVTSQIITNGPRNLVIKLTSVSDGTGEIGVKKVDATAFTPPPGVHLKLCKIRFAINGMSLRLQWDATTPIDMMPLAGWGNMDFKRFGGLTVPNVAGATGSILITTNGAVLGSTYDLVLEMTKNVQP